MSLFNLKDKGLSKAEAKELALLDASEYSRIKTRSAMNKGVRPWERVDTTSGLDPTQAWIGMEWENGFRSREAYEKAVDFVWASYHYVTVDAEGPGPWFGEFTFSPQNLDSFNDGTTPFHGLLNFMHDNDLRMPLRGSDLLLPEESPVEWVDPSPHPARGARPDANATWCDACNAWHRGSAGTSSDRSRVNMFRNEQDLRDGWGIHVNISLPQSRAGMSTVDRNIITERMNTSLRLLSHGQREEVFGRQPYGWCYGMGNGDGSQRWWEFKLFRTTDDRGDIAAYSRTINGLVKMLEHYCQGGRPFRRDEVLTTLRTGVLTLLG